MVCNLPFKATSPNNDSNNKIRYDRIKDDFNFYKMAQGSLGPLVEIVAYAQMDNHFHLLIKEIQDSGIVKFMSKLLTAYSTYMNKKYDRTGPLMCRPFRAKHVDSDEYFR